MSFSVLDARTLEEARCEDFANFVEQLMGSRWTDLDFPGKVRYIALTVGLSVSFFGVFILLSVM